MYNCLKRLSWLITSGLMVVVFAFFVHKLFFSGLPHGIKQVFRSLSELEASYNPLPQRRPGPHVLVGFGGCIDLNIRALTLLTYLNVKPPSKQDHHLGLDMPAQLNTLEDILLEFTQMFALGAAAERFVQNATLFDSLVRAVERFAPEKATSPSRSITEVLTAPKWPHRPAGESGTGDEHPPDRPPDVAWWSLGGNAAVMAGRLAREGASVTLAARLSTRQRQQLPNGVRVVAAPASFDLPDEPMEDIHLVLEYKAGERWGDFVAPRANRYILLHDKENPLLSGLWHGLFDIVHTIPVDQSTSDNRSEELKAPELFVLGGLQTMDKWTPLPGQTDPRPERIAELERFLGRLSSHTLVHFEMASFVDQALAVELIRHILPHVDSMGLNEQELPNLVSLLTDGRITTVSSSAPRIAHMLDAMRAVWSLLNDPSLPQTLIGSPAAAQPRRHLSRLHLHTLAFQLIAVRRHVQGGRTARLLAQNRMVAGQLPLRRTDLGLAWPFTRAAAAKASLIAHRHTCAAAAIDPERTRLLMDESFAITADPQRWQSALKARMFSSSDADSGNIPRIRFNFTSPVNCWREPEPILKPDLAAPDVQSSPNKPETELEICIAPVPVCSSVRRTAGCGDNISAGALRVQTISTT